VKGEEDLLTVDRTTHAPMRWEEEANSESIGLNQYNALNTEVIKLESLRKLVKSP
jgi:hypothetical protein